MGSLHAMDYWDPQDAHNHHHTDEYTTHAGWNRNNSDNVHGGTELTTAMHAECFDCICLQTSAKCGPFSAVCDLITMITI